MKLTEEDLLMRYEYWRARIGETGIWNPGNFKHVMIIVRKRSKTYDGLFCREWVKVGDRLVLQDSIVIYQQYPDITQQEIDNTLVHEMIHQYINQNEIKDSGTHGRVFKEFMCRINDSFPNELNLMVSAGISERRGPSEILHKLILVYHESGVCHCCKVNPRKEQLFVSLIEEHRKKWKILKYRLCESYDRYFDSFTACTHTLHGVRMNEKELDALCHDCKIMEISGHGFR